jgi:hypothetical protein
LVRGTGLCTDSRVTATMLNCRRPASGECVVEVGQRGDVLGVELGKPYRAARCVMRNSPASE